MSVREGPVRALIEEDLRRRSSPFVVARKYGTTVRVVENIAEEIGLAPRRSAVVSNPDLLELVRKELRPFVIQIKPVMAKWHCDSWLKEAHANYDAGLIELCTGRIRASEGDYLVLYAIARSKPIKRRPYFSVAYEG